MNNAPSVAVLRIDVAAELDEELDDLEVAGADGVVQGGDALVVGRARVGHLLGGLADELELALEAGVEQQGQRIEADAPRQIDLARGRLEVALLAPYHVGRRLAHAHALELDRLRSEG